MRKTILAKKSSHKKGKQPKREAESSQALHSQSMVIIPEEDKNLEDSEMIRFNTDEISSSYVNSGDKNNINEEIFEEEKRNFIAEPKENNFNNIPESGKISIENSFGDMVEITIPKKESMVSYQAKINDNSEKHEIKIYKEKDAIPSGDVPNISFNFQAIEVNSDSSQSPKEEIESSVEEAKYPIEIKNEELDLISIPKENLKASPIDNQEIVDQSALEIIEGLFTVISDYANNKATSIQVSQKIKEKAIEMSSIVPERHHLKPSILKFLTSIFCSSCKNNSPELHLGCSHSYCTDCAKHLIPSDFSQIVQNLPKCIICHHSLSENDLRLILGPLWSQINPSCIFCGSNNFYSDDKCKHYCKDCLSFDLRAGWIKCKFCEKPFDIEKLKNRQSKCKGCGNWVFDIGDYFISVCGQDYHPLCFICSEQSLQNKQCFACSAELVDDAIAKLEYVLFTTCIRCKKTYERGYFTMKTCCDNDICLLCHMLNEENCLSCKNPLPENSKKTIKYLNSQKKS
ncbi:unnamed protein product [Blepharisma stoltei]|uniref:RING-type domain-containing protein n=1 Tax=Blepharisma stoltei TaxID=1481888 RepID=A0AAU9J343_9CILI|nr:unnamed protein product [Blepharisma stoltei]